MSSHESPAAALDLSVVVPVFNAARTIGDQLTALLRQQWTGTWEVVIADNGSTDGTRAIVEKFALDSERIRIVDASQRRGPSHARNAGAAEARGERLAFCDADDVVSDGWLACVGDALRTASFVTGPQEQARLNPPWLRNVFGTDVASRLQVFVGVFPFGPSANLGIQRELFVSSGGFDPTMLVGEDLDLCLRLWHRGIELVFLPDAVVHYRNRSSLTALWRQAVSYGAASVTICTRLAEMDLPTPSRWRGIRNWLWLVRHVPSLPLRAGRARWVVVAGGCAGRAVGSIRQRSLYL